MKRTATPRLRKFVLRFIGTWLGLTIPAIAVPALGEGLRRLTALSLAGVLPAMGVGAVARGTRVDFTRGGAFEIITECTTLYVMPVFVAAVVAVPVGWRQRGLGLAVGLPLLAILNLLRLVLLAFVQRDWPAALPFLHDYLSQVLFAGAVIVGWWAWYEMARRATSAARPARG